MMYEENSPRSHKIAVYISQVLLCDTECEAHSLC